MISPRFLISCFVSLAFPLVSIGAEPSDFNDGWYFHLGDLPGAEAKSFPDTGWESAALPHTARIEALVTNHKEKQQWEGICWYRKTFTLPESAAGQTVWVRFEGAMNRATLFANGEKIAVNTDGYLPLVGDLTSLAKSSEPITLAVRLDNASSQETGPKPLATLDFHLYHGVYRTASLVVRPPLHITDEILENKPASGGVFVTYPQVSTSSATVNAQVHVRNRDSSAASFSVVTRLTDLAGEEIVKKETPVRSLAAGQEMEIQTTFDVLSPKLWSPRSPHLYHLETAIVSSGKIVDSKRERIGIRRIGFTPGGIMINGEKFFLRGVNRHQEYPFVGNAVPANAQFRDAYLIKQAGFDYVRLSHYPQSPAFMDACDELGLVTMTAIMGWQFNPATEPFYKNRVKATRELIRRDRNHPSAVMWEVSLNETEMTPDFIKRLIAAARDEYPGDQMLTAGWMKGFDVKGTARQHGSTEEFKNVRFPAIITEYGDWEYYAGNAGLNQDSWTDLKKEERNSRQQRGNGEVRLLQQATNFQESHNENLGTQAAGDGLWVMFDYNRGYAEDLEASGVADIFRLPKFSYYFYQSQRDASERPGAMAFIASYWTENSPLDVRVFSNGDEVELYLNNKSLGRQKPDQNEISRNLRHPPFTFKIPAFQAGELKAIAYLGGKVVAEHRVKTPGAAHALKLNIDLSGKPLAAGGDLVFLRARILDENGTLVPDATRMVKFTVEGDASIIGENPIAAEAGIATVLLKTGVKRGPLQIKATSDTMNGEIVVDAE